MFRHNPAFSTPSSSTSTRHHASLALRVSSLALILLGAQMSLRGQIVGDEAIPKGNLWAMTVTGIPQSYHNIRIEATAAPGSYVVFAFGTENGFVRFPFGVLLIDPGTIFATVVVGVETDGVASLDLRLPRLPNDARFVTQAGILDPSGSLSLTNSFRIVIQGDIMGTWSSRAPLPTSRGALAAEALPDGIHVLGGALTYGGAGLSTAHDVYVPERNWWSSRAPLPDSDTWGLRSAVVGGKLYALGGWPNGGRRNRVYDPATDSWSYLAEIPQLFSWKHTVSAVGDQIYIIGQGGIWAYDVQTDAWTSKSPAPSSSQALASAAVGGKIYVVGEGNTLSIYDPASDNWSSGPALHHAVNAPSAAAHGGKLYVFGGPTKQLDVEIGLRSDVHVFDPDIGHWKMVPDMPTSRTWSAAATFGNRIFVFGGFRNNGEAVNACEDVR